MANDCIILKGNRTKEIIVMHTKRIPLETRLWPKIEKRGEDECWPWLAHTDKDGYGAIWDAEIGDNAVATRALWKVLYGEYPDRDILVCHTCDNPGCMNPKHLFLGTCKDNSQDMIHKGRRVKALGERHGNHKLTQEQVLFARKMRKTKEMRLKDLAEMFGISKSALCTAVKGITWNWIEET